MCSLGPSLRQSHVADFGLDGSHFLTLASVPALALPFKVHSVVVFTQFN